MSDRDLQEVTPAKDARGTEIPVHNESRRLRALHALDVLDSPPEEAFDDIARLASAICGTPIALVSLVDAERQWFKAHVGLPLRETPRSMSFCAHAIQQADDLFIVPETLADERFRENPLVTGEPHMRFYAGATLATDEGEKLGTLCVIDREPRTLDDHQKESLRLLARHASALLAMRRVRAERRRLREDQERANADLAYQAALLESQMEAMPVGILVVSPEGRIVSYNGRFCEMWGISEDAVSGGDDAAVLQAVRRLVVDPDAFLARVRAVYANPDAVAHDEIRFVDGRVFERHGAPVRGEEGRRYGRIWTFRDVTEQRHAAEAMRRSEDRFRLLSRATNDTVWDWNLEQNTIWWNDNFYEMFGYAVEEVEPDDRSWTSRIRPEDRERVLGGIHAAIAGDAETWSDEYRFRRKDGAYADILDRGFIIRDAAGKAVRMVGSMMDVTDRRRAERELERTRHHLESILESAGEGIYGVDHEGRTTIINAAALRMLGLTREQAIGRPLHNVIHHSFPDGSPYPADACPVYRAARGGPSTQVKDECFFRADGTSFPVEYVTSPLTDGKRVVGAVTVFKDITARREAERALRESESRHRLLAEHSKDLITRSDAEGRLVYVSPACRDLLGYAPEELVGTVARDLVHPDDVGVIAPIREALQRGEGPQTLTMRYRRKDGSYAWVEVAAQPVRDPTTGAVSEIIASWRDIGDRKKVEDALRESEERFRSLSASSPIGVFMADMQGRATYTNASARSICGFREDEALGNGWTTFIHPDDQARVARGWQHYAMSGQPYSEEFRWLHKDGTVRWSHVRAAPVLNDEGAHVGHVGTVEDITDRIHAREAIERERTLLTTILQQMPAGVIVAEAPDGKLLLANHEVNRILGHDPIPTQGLEQYAQYTAYALDGRRLEVPELPLIRALTQGETVTGHELYYQRADGSRALLLVNAAPVRDADGKILAAVADFIDITDRKVAEDALRQSEERYRFLANAVPNQVWTATPDGALDYVNGRAIEFFGRNAEDLLGKGWHALIHPDDVAETAARWEAAVREGEAFEAEFRLRRNDGVYRWHIGRASALRDEGGAIVKWFGANVDITENKEAQAALRERAEELTRLADELRDQRNLVRTITDNAGSALFMMDKDGYPTFMNPAACELTGYASVDEIKDKPLHYAIHFKRPDGSHYPMEECPIDQANAQIVPLKDQREVFCRKDGALFPVQFNVAPVRKDGKDLGAVLEVRDVTEQERAEQELRSRAEELAQLAAALERSNRELDQFAYVTSHDLKAPLRGIANLATWIEEDLGDAVNDESRQHLDLLRGRVHRMESLIDAILQYSRVGRIKSRPEPVRVDELLRETVDLISPPESFRVEWAAPMPELVAERSRLQQVFMNLIGNAVKHHHEPEKGLVRISAEDAGDFWQFTVADNGPGISPRFHEKIFVIFQTLEARDKVEGTGVGLALVKKIVQTQGGSIEIDSDEGRGATFRFTWPKQPPAQQKGDSA